jgi:hypothetical protein
MLETGELEDLMDIDYLGPIILTAVGLVGLLILLITHGPAS